MLNLIPVLFLIFGWIYNVKGLVITALVIASLFMIIVLGTSGSREDNKVKTANVALFIQIVVLTLSIVKLCIM